MINDTWPMFKAEIRDYVQLILSWGSQDKIKVKMSGLSGKKMPPTSEVSISTVFILGISCVIVIR